MSTTTITATPEPTLSIEMLHSEITLLKQQVAVLVAKQHYAVKDNWLRAVLGRFKDDPEFDNIV